MFMSGSGMGWSGWTGKRDERCYDVYKDGKEDGQDYAGEGMKDGCLEGWRINDQGDYQEWKLT